MLRRRCSSRSRTAVHPGRAGRARRRGTPCRVDDSRSRQLPQPRVPPGPARPDAARARDVLDLARADVRRRRPAHPDSYFELARATYREMVSVGITSVGEFHYLHHGPDGTPYDDPNAMSHALVEAAREAGLRIALLDTCYLAAGIGRPAEGVQRRFCDGTADGWLSRRPVTNAAVSAAGRGTSDGSTVAVRRRDPLRARRTPRPDADRRGLGRRARRAAARAPVRAGRGERRLPGGVRRDADRGARRGRRPGGADHRRARHPPDRPATSRCSAERAPAPASAPPPSATSATASARRGDCTTPAPADPRARTATR